MPTLISSLKAGDATMAIVAELPVKADGGAGFEEATLPLLNDVQSKEDGNLLYCLGKADETTYVFTELYTNMDAIKLHGGTDYFKAGGKRQGPFMGGKPKISMLQTVGESGAKPTHKAAL